VAAQPAVTVEDVAATLREQTKRWRADPVAFVLETFTADPSGRPVTVDPAQAEIMRAVARGSRVAVRSSHGVGKTTTAAWLTLWWLATRSPALVVTCAGTWNHLTDKLWPEIRSWGKTWRLRDAFDWQETGIYSTLNPDGWRAVQSSSDKPENIEGWHSPHLLVLIDEAKAMADEVWDAIRGALTSGDVDGEPPRVGIFSTPPLTPAGWYAGLFKQQSEGWRTIHIDGMDSSRVSKSWAAEMLRDYGADSPVYQSKVRGQIPENSTDALISIASWEAAQKRRHVGDDGKGVAAGLDIAGEGDDLTVLSIVKNRQWSIPVLEDGKRTWHVGRDVMQAVGLAVRAIKELGVRVLALDDTGLGGGVTARLYELQRAGKLPGMGDLMLVPINFGSSAWDEHKFARIKDQLWWELREEIRQGPMCLPTDDEIRDWNLPRGTNPLAQFTSPLYGNTSSGKLVVFDKRGAGGAQDEKMRERMRTLPAKSPDVAHSCMLARAAYARMRVDERIAPAKTTHEVQQREVAEMIRTRTGEQQPRAVADPYRNLWGREEE
jgi:phage terminase large subunit